jgi:hypothetical protein
MMKKEANLLLAAASVFLISCGVTGGKDYTYEELQTYTDELTPLGTPFWDEFGGLRDKYKLTDTESKILGEWNGLETNITRSFYFYPNGFFMVGLGSHYYKNNRNRYLSQGYGVWEVRGNILVVTMYSFYSDFRKTETSGRNPEFFTVKPYEVKLINMNDVDPGGYTRKPFERFILPEELRPRIHIPPEARKKAIMVRSIYTIHVITNSGKPEKNYGFLKVVPEMAAKDLSGLDIAANPELAGGFFANLVF